MIISPVFKIVYAHLYIYTYIHVFKCPQRPEVRFTQLPETRVAGDYK